MQIFENVYESLTYKDFRERAREGRGQLAFHKLKTIYKKVRI